MCREIIEQHHGRIRVESTVGLGTAFTLKLPAAPAEIPSHSTLPLPTLGIPITAALSPA
jgi:K+-sensing histidine kinase KdpD